MDALKAYRGSPQATMSSDASESPSAPDETIQARLLSEDHANMGPSDPLEVLHLVPPSTVGIGDWLPGETAEYKRTTADRSEPTAVDVTLLKAAQETDAYFRDSGEAFSGQWWLRARGLSRFRDVEVDLFRLVTPTRFLISPETPSFDWPSNYIPVIGVQSGFNVGNYEVLKEASEELQLGKGKSPSTLLCDVFRVVNKSGVWLATLWMHREARPLGLVKYESADETIMLTGLLKLDISNLVSGRRGDLIDGRSSMFFGCSDCHVNGVQGGALLRARR